APRAARPLPSFPTRRSSDLHVGLGARNPRSEHGQAPRCIKVGDRAAGGKAFPCQQVIDAGSQFQRRSVDHTRRNLFTADFEDKVRHSIKFKKADSSRLKAARNDKTPIRRFGMAKSHDLPQKANPRVNGHETAVTGFSFFSVFSFPISWPASASGSSPLCCST